MREEVICQDGWSPRNCSARKGARSLTPRPGFWRVSSLSMCLCQESATLETRVNANPWLTLNSLWVLVSKYLAWIHQEVRLLHKTHPLEFWMIYDDPDDGHLSWPVGNPVASWLCYSEFEIHWVHSQKEQNNQDSHLPTQMRSQGSG